MKKNRAENLPQRDAEVLASTLVGNAFPEMVEAGNAADERRDEVVHELLLEDGVFSLTVETTSIYGIIPCSKMPTRYKM